MCGIGGVLLAASYRDQRTLERGALLQQALRHRGPDAEGVWTEDGVALVHTRLAIVDPTPTGAQPMRSPDGRYVLVFNGEIYNDGELRSELLAAGHRFVGRSDTEVLLHMLAERGVRALPSLDGMFAFALYDRRERRLLCARDPLGEKPLYYVHKGGYFAFASEVSALVAAGLASSEVDPRALALLLRHGSIPHPYTHLADVRMLEPGTWIDVRHANLASARSAYWSIPFSTETEAPIDRAASSHVVHEALRRSVRRRLRADVPVAAFLSGGVDSALTCALLVEAGAKGLHAFTVTLPGQRSDEARAARAIALRLGLRHEEVPLEVDDDGAWLDQALAAMDVPSNDGPNTWLVARAVAQAGYKVAFSGLGGDELFFGYPTFQWVPRAARMATPLRPVRQLRSLRQQLRALSRKLPLPSRASRVVEALADGGSLVALWLARRATFSEREVAELLTESVWLAAQRTDSVSLFERRVREDVDAARAVSMLELSSYMHDQLLRDTDTMSMAHGVEVRAPLIGMPVVEAVARIPTAHLAAMPPKALLRSIVATYLPASVLTPGKQGFVVPCGPPRSLQSAAFAEATAKILNAAAVARNGSDAQRLASTSARDVVLAAIGHAMGKVERLSLAPARVPARAPMLSKVVA